MARLAKQWRLEGMFLMTLRGGPACPLSWAGWAHVPTQAKKPIPLQADSKGGIGRASMCSRPTISTPLLMDGNLNPASAHRTKGRKMQTPTCLLSNQRFSWTDCPSPCMSSPQQARGCAGDLCVAYGLSEDQELLLFRKFLGFPGIRW